MHKLVKLLPAALLCCAALAHAQLYKSVGPDGRVTYSDAPPTVYDIAMEGQLPKLTMAS